MTSTDWLSQLLSMVPVSGALDYRCMLGTPWRIEHPSTRPGEIPFHAVVEGSAIVEVPGGGPPQRLVAGDILLLPHGSQHILRDGSKAEPALVRARQTLSVTIKENDGPGARFDMLCGRFVLSDMHERLVRTYFPLSLIVRAPESAAASGSDTGQRVAGLVALMRAESANENLGGKAMLNALTAALFAVTMRLAGEAGSAPEGLLALAGNPRLTPALTALFNEPAYPWTLPELAIRCNMSRATFIRHFQERLGRSAADLLTDIRMTLAANMLRASDLSTGAVAEAVGYQSEAAFQRAFKSYMGVTPAQWRRDARNP